jgi:hypothetical protein
MLPDLRRAVEGSVLETHPHYRTAIGALGVLLPIVLILSSLVQGRDPESSISAYYHTGARDWFVGILWVIGVFLFFYQYRPQTSVGARSQRPSIQSGAADAWLGKVAGIGAVVVALFPTEPPPELPTQPPEIGMVHGVAAAALFICLALFPLLLFSQSRENRRKYVGFGVSMLTLLALIAVYAFAPDGIRQALAPAKPVLVLESLLVWIFGLSWFEKGRELARAARTNTIADRTPMARAS